MRAVRQSPGRARPAEAGLWLPLPDVDALPELEEWLLGDCLVDSGQTIAIRALVDDLHDDLESAVTLIDPDVAPDVHGDRPVDADALLDDLDRVPADFADAPPASIRAFVEPAPRPAPEPAPSVRPTGAPGLSYHPSELVAFHADRAVAFAPRRSRAAVMAARRARRNHRRVFALVLLAVAVAIATLWPKLFGRPATTLRIAVDGVTSIRSVDASTVGEALQSTGVRLGGFDRAAPSLATPLRSHMTVEVTRAVPLTVSVDGGSRTVLTAAASVEALREQLGLRPTLLVRGNAITAGATVAFRTPRHVSLTVDGATVPSTASARTVGEFLDDQHVVVGVDDIVQPSRETLLQSGTTVQVVRVAGQYTTDQQPLHADVEYTKDPSMPKGQSRVVQSGVDGLRLDTYRLTTHDGQVADRERISSVIQKAPVPKIVALGAEVPVVAPKVVAPPAAGSSSGATAAPMASVSTSHREVGNASWYAYTAGTCAHKSIPKGTVVKVTNLATGVWTTCVVADRGPYGDGRILDLSRDVFAKLASNSSGVISVKAEW